MLKEPRRPKLIEALSPILLLILLLTMNVWYFGDATLEGANQIALLMAASFGSIIAIRLGHRWIFIREKIVRSIGSAMPSMLILLLIGSLAGTWMLSGVVPAMIYYGLQIVNPNIFLVSAVVISAIVSLATGSSWSTVATIGIALLGIGKALGIHEGLIAGAIISGAYFGDKISPLSDTTNLAPAMAGTDLFTHVKYMLFTTTPSLIITLVIFLIIGLTSDYNVVNTNVESVLLSIDQTYNITPWLFVIPVLLIVVIVAKIPPIPSLFLSTLLAGVFAIIFQPQLIAHVADTTGNYAKESYIAILKAMYGRVEIATDNSTVNELLITKGMAGMLNTIWLILSAMVFGGVMESAGLLKRITDSLIRFAKNTGSLVTTTAATCVFMNVSASDQYISIVVPGRMFAKIYKKRLLKPELLSRTLEDSGTVTSVLVPWNTCGATQSSVLGVATMSYLPYAFFNIISPFMTILFAYLNIKIRRYKAEEVNEQDEDDE